LADVESDGGVEVVLRPNVYPYSAATGCSLPTVESCVDGRVLPFVEGLEHLREHLLDLDASLSPRDAADVAAYSALVRDRLVPAQQYLFWIPDRNYTGVQFMHHAAATPFPLKVTLPWMARSEVRSRLGVNAARGATPRHSSPWSDEFALGELRAVYTLLSQRLAGTVFFFSNAVPSSLDALVAAHLAVHFHTPLVEPAGGLQKILRDEFPVLELYFQRTLAFFVPSYSPTRALELTDAERERIAAAERASTEAAERRRLFAAKARSTEAWVEAQNATAAENRAQKDAASSSSSPSSSSSSERVSQSNQRDEWRRENRLFLTFAGVSVVGYALFALLRGRAARGGE
jgi:hypothetical protein